VITESPFNWRGRPSIFTAPDPAKSRQQQSSERAWESGAQPAHRGKELAGNGLAKRLEVDADAMVRMRREGHEWREIASRFDVSVNTCRERCKEVAPELFVRKPYTPGPRNQIVIRTKADAVKTARIKGTGVRL
jgi:hypothetical protein